LTVDETDNLIDAFTTLRATNSLFGAVTNWGGPFTGFNNATNNGPSVFVTAGGAKHYLADDSFRNVGTTNISAALLADLKSTTTYPPIVYDIPGSYLSESLTLFPQAQRDYDLPDLGYHYDPLDYLFGGIVLSNVAIVLNPGTAIGLFSTNNLSVGLSLKTNSQFVSEGEAENLNRLVAYDMVQEQTRTGWERPRNLVSCSLQVSPTLMRFRFTDWSVPAGNDVLVNVSCDIGPINFQDCQFHGGMIEMLHPTCNFTNCLFERVNVTIDAEDANVPVIRNNLVYGGMFDFFTVQTNAVIKDNLFDRPVIPDEIGVAGGTYDGGCNAYVMNYDRLQPTNASDRILVSPPTYQAGALGRFYLPTNSPLINWGSVTNAGLVGLYHFTTVTNQLKETNSVVDIGFHYAALNTGSSVISPIDTDGDGVPDYLEDLNGNGLLSSGETDWQSAADLGLKVWITRPRNGSTIP
jgi:hypothetical protein